MEWTKNSSTRQGLKDVTYKRSCCSENVNNLILNQAITSTRL